MRMTLLTGSNERGTDGLEEPLLELRERMTTTVTPVPAQVSAIPRDTASCAVLVTRNESSRRGI